jgi:hypothetical protein
MVQEPQDGQEPHISVWYDLTDKERFPNTKTRETAFPYSKKLAKQIQTAKQAIQSGDQVSAVLEFFLQADRVKLEIGGPGAVDEIDVSARHEEKPDARIRPIGLSFS